ncbi:hypothetical protein V7D15_00595 [Thermoanaerobacter thermohydrosulfuricus]|uniref:hypothetical protein n=1 Tax=Thermoanaerobacter TaxID=1754 RepID=UPI000202D84F|nr:hypothetical protein [Thermoanaerobacter indiensis]EGD50780.1 hypothetical protein TheetDRAFT_2430 [Thermoanaerobacter ethanolicus JW 200]SFE52540.1 hypothetical protein SAMN04324257_01990 [Thermoanaerobacter thermohydrosulfuricus]
MVSNSNTYVTPSITPLGGGHAAEPEGIVALAVAAVLAATVWDVVGVVNYVAAYLVQTVVAVTTWVKAIEPSTK